MSRRALPLLALALLPAAARAQSFTPTLTAASHFPVVGGTLDLAVEAPAGALFGVHAASAPAEIPLGAIGTLRLDPLAQLFVGGGVVDAGGAGALSLPVPANPGLEGKVLFAQAGVVAFPEVRASNSVALRVGAAPPSGRRTTIAVAATPDGTRAFAAHRDDGSLTLVDATTDAVTGEVPIGPAATSLLHRPVSVTVAPDGGRVCVVNGAAEHLTVLDAATGSVVALVPAPRGLRRAAFDLGGVERRLYVTDEARDRVLVWREDPFASYVPLPAIELEGRTPGPLAVLPDGRLLVGTLGTHDLELVDPGLATGATTVARTPVGGFAADLVPHGAEVLVPLFVRALGATDGDNLVLRYDPSTAGVVGQLFDNLGTDYVDVAVGGGRVAVVGAGSGSLVVADAATLAAQATVDLGPGQPVLTPEQAAWVTGDRVYVANRFRETLVPVELAGGAPFSLGAEIPLAHGGAPRVPLLDLTPEEDGDWFFRSVQFFNGTPTAPNRVTCASCHPDAGALGPNIGAVSIPHLFELGTAAPYGWKGNKVSLAGMIPGLFGAHGTVGGTLAPVAHSTVEAYLDHFVSAPPSPHLALDGALTPAQAAGEALFQGAAGCTPCHTAPTFLPTFPAPPTFQNGVGTGLAPANVPTLRGLWASAPYLHDGSAETLLDVLELDTGNQHGTSAALTAPQRAELVEYLLTL